MPLGYWLTFMDLLEGITDDCPPLLCLMFILKMKDQGVTRAGQDLQLMASGSLHFVRNVFETVLNKTLGVGRRR